MQEKFYTNCYIIHFTKPTQSHYLLFSLFLDLFHFFILLLLCHTLCPSLWLRPVILISRCSSESHIHFFLKIRGLHRDSSESACGPCIWKSQKFHMRLVLLGNTDLEFAYTSKVEPLVLLHAVGIDTNSARTTNLLWASGICCTIPLNKHQCSLGKCKYCQRTTEGTGWYSLLTIIYHLLTRILICSLAPIHNSFWA